MKKGKKNMKIKGNFKKVNPMLPLYVLVGLLAVAIPLRICQLLFITEGDTGFYKYEHWSTYVMYILSGLAVLVPYVVMFLAKNVPSSKKTPGRKNLFLASTSILFGLGILLDVLNCSISLLFNNDNQLTEALTGQGSIVPALLEIVFGAFSVIYIIIFGISYIDGKTKYSQYKFLALTPIGWAMGRVIIRFLRKIAYINIADLMLELFALIFMLLFLLAFARISSGLANEGSMRSLFASGYACVFFCGVANVPRLVLTIIGQSSVLPIEYPLELCDLFCAVFVIAYIINAMKYARENDHAELYESDTNK